MDDGEEQRYYGDSTILEPIVEQQDDEVTVSVISSSSIDTNVLEEERRAREEIQQFEALEKEFASERHGIRVRFDDERLPSSTQTTLIRTEPCFQVNSTEDQVTKHFYKNESETQHQKVNESPEPTSRATPSEADSLEEAEEYTVTVQNDDNLLVATNQLKRGPHDEINSSRDRISSSSPSKSILRTSERKLKLAAEKIDHSSAGRSVSPPSQSQKQISSIRADSNEVQHLAEATAKQTFSQSTNRIRSLFEPTINIFGSSNPSSVPLADGHSVRLRYYVKPYRGDHYIQPEANKERSRSLSEQRAAQQTKPTVWYTFSNQYNRLSYGQTHRKHHVSWSPVREYIHQGRDKRVKSPLRKTQPLSAAKTSSLMSSHSSSHPCLGSSSPTSNSARYRSSRLSDVPAYFRRSFPPLSIDSFESSSVTNCSLTPVTPTSQYSQLEQKQEAQVASSQPDEMQSHQKERSDALQRYDRLLEKMRLTDQQLQTLSKSWVNNTSLTTKSKHKHDSALHTVSSNGALFSPVLIQKCLIFLVLFNLLAIYFFNDVNLWWNRSVSTT